MGTCVANVGLAEELLSALAAELARGEGGTRRPASTYRLQLHPGFGFDAAAAVVPYLDALGVTDVYLSPVLAAAPGSTHGYDVVDHARLDSELGGEEAYGRLAAACVARGMGILLDFVPNHMGIGARQRAGGWTCSRTGRRRSTPPPSTWTGRRSRPSSPTRCWSRCWATSSARCSSAASSGSRARTAPSWSATSTTSSRWRRARSRSCSGTGSTR